MNVLIACEESQTVCKAFREKGHNAFSCDIQVLPSGTGRKLGGDSYGAKKCAHDSKARSKTFLGIAKAMAEQWGNLNNESEENKWTQ